MFDLVISNGTVVDGSNHPAFRADVGITADRITAVGDLAGAEARDHLDAQGLYVAPGFIDVHNHSDGWLLKHGHLESKIAQGFTTEIIMADGISYAPVTAETALQWIYYLRALNGLQINDYCGWLSLDDYLKLMEGRLVPNVATHVPYANVRSVASGFSRRPVDDFDCRTILGEVRRGMQAGAVGLSTGLDYIVECYATTDEVVRACRVVAEYDGLYVTHVRYKSGLIPALREAVRIAEEAGVGLHVSHLKAHTPQTVEELLQYIDQEARHQVDFTFDLYPYHLSSTMLNYLLPYEVWDQGPLSAAGQLARPEIKERFRKGLHEYRLDADQMRIAWLPSRENEAVYGCSLSEYAELQKCDLAEAVYRLLLEERLSVLVVLGQEQDETVEPFVTHALSMMGTDGIFTDNGVVHPRQFGSVGRLLASYVRDRQLLSIETAIWKLAGYAADRFRLTDRGRIRAGAYADVVTIDLEHVRGEASVEQPRQLTKGIDNVLVNGEFVRRSGKSTITSNTSPGQILRVNGGE